MSGYLDSECSRLDIAMLRAAGALSVEPGEIKDGRFCLDPSDPTGGRVSWGVGADEHGKPQGVALLHRTSSRASVEQAGWLTTTACHYGGERYWFLCPAHGCGRRVRVLYLTPGANQFVCRHCAGVVHAVTRETLKQRLARREAKLESRLGWADSYGGPRPKGMHARTFKRLSTLHTVRCLERHTRVLDALLRQEGLVDLVSD